ncbi:MAG: hypothetical protein AB1416_05430 [Actinomycetota bacterium]
MLREPPPEPAGRDDSAAVAHADLFDEQAEEFFGLFGAFVGKDLVELVGEGGRVRRRVRLCGERASEFAFLLAEGLEALTVATDAFLAKRRRELSGSNASK